MFRFLVSFLFSIVTSVAFSADWNVGQVDLNYKDQSRDRKVSTIVWYPTDSNSKLFVSKSGPFEPVVAIRNTEISEQKKKYPVVLLSHGSGGTAEKLFWITKPLVEAGIIVIAVNHSGNRTGDNSGKGLIEVWHRAPDMSFALDNVLREKKFRGKLDEDKIAALGHSAGGTTALLLAGARFSHENFQSPVPNCKGTLDPYFAIWCKQIDKIDFSKYASSTITKNYEDPRVKLSIALDPGFVRSFDRKSIRPVATKLFVFLAEKIRTPYDEIYSSEFADLLKPQPVRVVKDSIHMSFIQACRKGVDKEDAELKELCAQNSLKKKIQKEVVTESLSILNQHLRLKTMNETIQ